MRGVGGLGEAEVVGQTRDGRIAVEAVLRPDDDREVGRDQGEAGEEPLGVWVRVGVEEAVRVGVAREEALETQCVARLAGADDHHSATCRLDEADPSQDEGPHDRFSDVRLARHHAAELRGPEPHEPAIGAGPAADQDLTVIEEVDLARELAFAMDGDGFGGPVPIRVEDLDRPLEHEEEVDAPLPPREKGRAPGNLLDRAVGRQAFRRLGIEARERLRVPLVGVRDLGVGVGRGLHRSRLSIRVYWGSLAIRRRRDATNYAARSPSTEGRVTCHVLLGRGWTGLLRMPGWT